MIEELARISNARHPWAAGPRTGAFREEAAMFHLRRPSFIQRPQPTRVLVARTGSRLGQLFSLAGIIDLPAEGDGLTESERQLTLKVHQQLGTMERSGLWLRQPAE